MSDRPRLHVVPPPKEKADFGDWTEAKDLVLDAVDDLGPIAADVDVDEVARRLGLWGREKWKDGYRQAARDILNEKADEYLARRKRT